MTRRKRPADSDPEDESEWCPPKSKRKYSKASYDRYFQARMEINRKRGAKHQQRMETLRKRAELLDREKALSEKRVKLYQQVRKMISGERDECHSLVDMLRKETSKSEYQKEMLSNIEKGVEQLKLNIWPALRDWKVLLLEHSVHRLIFSSRLYR